MKGSVSGDNAQIVSTFEQKGSKRSLLSRSLSDSVAVVLQGGSSQKALSNFSFDDHDIEPLANSKPASLMSSSNSLPNLAALNTEPLPDTTTWTGVDLPFDIYENFATESLENMSDSTKSGRSPANKSETIKRKHSAAKIEVGIADKTPFFREEQQPEPHSRAPGMPPMPLSPKLSAIMEETRSQQNSSSSASMDTRDSMRELANKITPVERDGVEFAPLDISQLPSMSGSYSMSVDESMLMQDTSLNQGSEKKGNFELPESFSMSSWSQHSISVDMFAAHNLPVGEFSRDGLLLGRRHPSDQSITECMLNEEDWNIESFDFTEGDELPSAPVTDGTSPQLTQHSLRQHQSRAPGRGGARESSRAGGARAPATGRGGRSAISRGVKMNDSGRVDEEGIAGAQKASDREASVPVQQLDARQYSYPSTYSATLARSNSGPASSVASNSTSSSVDGTQSSMGHPSHLAPALYDPTTGIVYFPQGGAVAANASGPLPAHLPINTGRSPSHGERGLPAARISDDGLTPDCFAEEGGFLTIDSVSTGFSASGSGKFDRFELGYPGSVPGSSTTTPKQQAVKKEKNRGSYRCGRCGKPKVNHVCAFVDASTMSQAVQASGPVLNPNNMLPFPGDRVITVNSNRKSIHDTSKSIHDTKYESYGMEAARGNNLRQVSRSNSGLTNDSLARSASSAMSDTRNRSNSGSGAIFSSLSRSGDDLFNAMGVPPRSPGSAARMSVGFSVPLTQTQAQVADQKDIAQQQLASESDDVFFPTTFPPSAGLVFSSRNSSVNSTYGNESDTSSTCGEPAQQRSTLSNMFSADLGLGRFFRF